MLIALAAVAYALPYLVCCRMVAGHVAWSDKCVHYTDPTGGDWAWGWLLGAVAALVWPLLAVGYVVHSRLGHFPRFRWAIGAERTEREKADRKRIAQLERELGLR